MRGAAGGVHQWGQPRRADDGQLDELTRPWLSPAVSRRSDLQIAAADERFTDEIEDLYAGISLPVLVVWGRDEPGSRSTSRASTGADDPGAQLEIIDGAGHLIQYDAPAELAAALQRWLTASRG